MKRLSRSLFRVSLAPASTGTALALVLAVASVSSTPTLAASAGATKGAARPLWTDVKKGARPLVQAPSVAPLVAKVEPAVLVIFTEVPASALPDGHPPVGSLPPGHPPMGDGSGPIPFGPGGPFGHGGPGDGENVQGQGAGFLITADGYALTNHHVIEDAVRVTVSVGEEHNEIEATVVGSDEKSDVALIKLNSPRTDWPVALLADSDRLKVGDYVVAIGSPFGLEQSVSLGILSARGRRDIAPSGRQGLYDFLQTDASINPGNSGGPLLDVYGGVVGINSAVNAAGSGIGFAIPINQVKRMLPALQATGRFERSWLGVSIQSVRPELVRGLGLTSRDGALVREVIADGPAAAAGLAPGDVIVRFDGRRVRDANELPLLAGDAGVGATVDVSVMRDGTAVPIKITLGSHPENAERRMPAGHGGKGHGHGKTGAGAHDVDEAKKEPPAIGLSILNLGADDRSRLHLAPGDGGARISKIKPGSPAAIAGLASDDVIISIDGTAIKDAASAATIIRDAPSGAVLKLLIRRGPSTVFAALAKP